MRLHWIATALAVLAAPLCWGQPTYGTYTFVSAPGGGSYTTVVSGDFDDDKLADVAYLRGTEATMVFAPDAYGATARYELAGPFVPVVTAIATLENSVGRDELLIADANGLSAWERLDTSVFSSRTIGSTTWTNARALATGDAGTIFGLHQNGTQFGVGPVNETWYSIPGIGTDITVLDWDSDGNDDIAIACTTGLLVYSASGVQLAVVPTPTPIVDVAAISERNQPDRVVFVGKDPFGLNDWLVTLGSTVMPYYTILGDMDVVGLAAGDANGDGIDDLVLSHQSDGSLELLYNQGVPGAFLPTSNETITGRLDTVSPTNFHTPVMVDTNGDGDLEIVRMVPETEECLIHENVRINPESQMPGVVQIAYTPNGSIGYIALEFSAGLGGVPAGATQIEVVVWEMQNPLGPDPTTDSTPIFSARGALPGTSQAWTIPVIDSSPANPTAVWFWAVRFVDWNSVSNTYDRVFPMRLNALTTQVVGITSGTVIDFLMYQSGQNGPSAFVTIDSPGGPGPWAIPAGIDPENTGSHTEVRPTPGSNQLPNPGT